MRLHHCLLGAVLLAAPSLAFAQSTMAPSTTPHTPTAPAKTAPSSMAPMSSMSKPAGSGMASAAGDVTQYTTESSATSACAGDTVVWANPKSKALHLSGTKWYGKSKHGFYACEKQALASGYHLGGKKKAKTAG